MSAPVVVRSLRELDALVAEKVLGCTAIVRRDQSWKDSGAETDGMKSTTWRCKCAADHNWPQRDVLMRWGIKGYSEDIAAAWEVVEKLRHLHPCIYHGGNGWEVGFEDVAIPGVWPSLPLAICVCALKAVGVEVELRLEP